MKKRLKTLLLDSNGFSWKDAAADTVLLGLLRARNYDFVPKRLRDVRFFRLLKARYDALGYVADWREAFCESPALEVRVCNVTNLVEYATCLRSIRAYDLVVVLHAAAGDSLMLIDKGVRWLRRRRGKLVVFIGNEYDLMTEKLAFVRAAHADYVCTQLPFETARWLYDACEGVQVLPMPHALNPRVYRPALPADRSINVGFAGAMYPLFIGDVERTRLIRALATEAPRQGLTCDIRTSTIGRLEWAAFLSRCQGTVGGEAGTYYLDRRGELVARAKQFLAEHPDATFDEVYDRFFKRPRVKYVSGKCVSSRHFEAIGTMTCQILVEGDYNGILKPNVHYIAVRKDLSNLDSAIARFKDDVYRNEMIERAYEYVTDEHTHAHRVRALVDAVGG